MKKVWKKGLLSVLAGLMLLSGSLFSSAFMTPVNASTTCAVTVSNGTFRCNLAREGDIAVATTSFTRSVPLHGDVRLRFATGILADAPLISGWRTTQVLNQRQHRFTTGFRVDVVHSINPSPGVTLSRQTQLRR